MYIIGMHAAHIGCAATEVVACRRYFKPVLQQHSLARLAATAHKLGPVSGSSRNDEVLAR